MNIEIKNCNNIDSANIAIHEQKLNIKFAPNGTGKSTIAKAIRLSTEEDAGALDGLLPFKFVDSNPDNKKPEVVGAEHIESVMCFNEDYVSKFVFQQDELVSNSFDIFIRTEKYEEREKEIAELVADIKQLFVGNQQLEDLISTLKEMGDAFKPTKTGLSKASPGMKGLAHGNKIQHIPSGLEAYKPFIQCANSVGWVDWQTKGYEFSDLSDSCPFCTSHAADKKERIRKVGLEYDKNIIKNLVKIIDVIERLGEYFSEDASKKLEKLTTLKDGLEEEHVDFLASVKGQIEGFVNKLERLRTLSGFQFKDGEKVAELLPSYKLDLELFYWLNSDKTQGAITPINNSIESVMDKAGLLQGKINQQRQEMQRIIKKHQEDINGFLAYAGYRYQVEIVGEDEQSRLRLSHMDHSKHLSGGDQHLSFGERNAFAIVLFMYECVAKEPDLIILDDPISSFDNNKKYAILEMLFRRNSDSCLKNKSVLMLTHDLEPIIDTVRALAPKFKNQTSASFLRMLEGKITEKEITKEDLQTFARICDMALESEKDDIIKLIYLRRKCEILNDKGDAYQVLSNLFHKRRLPEDSREPRGAVDESHPQMDPNKFEEGCTEIKGYFHDFSYDKALARIVDQNDMKMVYASCPNGYEKLQVFRLLPAQAPNSIIKKFIDETYHIENEFICQLDPAKFDIVPEYVIKECDKVLAEA